MRKINTRAFYIKIINKKTNMRIVLLFYIYESHEHGSSTSFDRANRGLATYHNFF